MKRRTVSDTLRSLGACHAAVCWSAQYGTAAKRAWAECSNPSYMFWLLGRLDIDRRWIAMCGAWCAVPALAHVPRGEHRPHDAVWATVQWARGESGDAELDAAWAAARDAARDAARAAASNAARAAARAAARDAARAAAWAAWAAARDAASNAASNAAWAASLAHSADCIRAVVPWGMVERALREKGGAR